MLTDALLLKINNQHKNHITKTINKLGSFVNLKCFRHFVCLFLFCMKKIYCVTEELNRIVHFEKKIENLKKKDEKIFCKKFKNSLINNYLTIR